MFLSDPLRTVDGLTNGGGIMDVEWTVREATAAYLRQRVKRGELSKASERGYRARLDSFMVSVGADRQASRLQRRHVERWIETLGVLAPTSRRSYWATARLFCRWLRDRGVVAADLFDGLQAPREPRTVPRNLAPEDVAAVLAVCDPRQRIVAVLMLQLGLRRGEVARMCVEDIDLGNRVALVKGKGGHERVLPIPEQAVAELRRWMVGERVTSGPVVRSKVNPHAGVTAETIGLLLVDVMYEAGVKNHAWDRVSGHSLRHTAAADMLRHGAHVRDVQAVLGHSALSTTERYLPLVVDTLSGAVGGRSY